VRNDTVTSILAVFKSHYEYYDAGHVDLEDLLRVKKHKTANEAHTRSHAVICTMEILYLIITAA